MPDVPVTVMSASILRLLPLSDGEFSLAFPLSISYTGGVRERIIIEGELVDANTLPMWRAGKTGILAELAQFLATWFSPCPWMTLHTSGSTGKPKEIHASKDAMRASAHLSCQALEMQPGDTALLCLPLRYIAGQMMVVRALIGNLNLLIEEPSSTPLGQRQANLVSLVPMQAITTLQQPDGAAQLNRMGTILLGGGFIPAALEEALQPLSCRVFATYGMTETLSHIALRPLNGTGRSAWYRPLPGISLQQTREGTLSITAPHLGIAEMATHDRAELRPDGCFRILGRLDTVINSGGIKIQAEELETRLQQATGLAILARPLPHPVLGECIELLWEGRPEDEPRLRRACEVLPRYYRPHSVQRVDTLPRTLSGKLIRTPRD